jgi:hypothetical protein
VKTAVKSAIQEAIDPSARRKRLRTLDTVALSVLFFPVALYYAVNRYKILFVFIQYDTNTKTATANFVE